MQDQRPVYSSSISAFFLLQARQTKDPLNPLEMEAGFNMVSGKFLYNITGTSTNVKSSKRLQLNLLYLHHLAVQSFAQDC